MSYALLFSGQGMQHPDMLSWLARDGTVQVVEQLFGGDWRQQLAAPEWAGRNALAQPLLTGLALAALEQLSPLLPAPTAVAGYSVGELAAFAATGVYDVATALTLAQRRAASMDACAADYPTGLLGISGMVLTSVMRLCADFGLKVAIRNGIDSVVVGGPRLALSAAEKVAQREGARCTRLNVQVASHTPWMADAAQSFAALIAPLPFASPRCALFTNVAGRVATVPQLKQALARQISQTVRWDECMDGIAARKVKCVLEIGPGQALARMWNQRYVHIPGRSVDEFRSAHAIAQWVHRWST